MFLFAPRTHFYTLEAIDRAVEKLTWVLFNAQDWALRYAAVVWLQEIATTEAICALQEALATESDAVVRERIKTALESWDLPRSA